MLSPFPVDDVTLNLLDHALDSFVDDDGVRVGADMGVWELLDFLSGPSECMELDGYSFREVPAYSLDDVLRALIGEVRRLRDGT